MSQSAAARGNNLRNQTPFVSPVGEEKKSGEPKSWLDRFYGEEKAEDVRELYTKYEGVIKSNSDMSNSKHLQLLIIHLAKLKEQNLHELTKYTPFMRAMIVLAGLKDYQDAYKIYFDILIKLANRWFEEDYQKEKTEFLANRNSDGIIWFAKVIAKVEATIVLRNEDQASIGKYIHALSLCSMDPVGSYYLSSDFAKDHLTKFSAEQLKSLSYFLNNNWFIEGLKSNIQAVLNHRLNAINPAIIHWLYKFLDKDEPVLQKATSLRNLFTSIKESKLVKEASTVHQALYKALCTSVRNQMNVQLKIDSTLHTIFMKKEESLVKTIAETAWSSNTLGDALDTLEQYMEMTLSICQADAGLQSLRGKEKTVASSQQDQKSSEDKAPDKPVLPASLVELQKKICKQAELEMTKIVKSNSSDYRTKASAAILMAAMAFKNPNKDTVDKMIKSATELADLRSNFGSWLLIVAGVLVMVLGCVASVNTLGISAHIGQEWGMKLILLGAASLTAGVANSSHFQLFNSNLEKTMKRGESELRKYCCPVF